MGAQYLASTRQTAAHESSVRPRNSCGSTADDAVALGVVVLSFGNGPAPQCVERLRATGCPMDELIVVHNEAAARETPEFSDDVSVVKTGGNLGYAGGMNVGLRYWRGSASAIALVTHDVEVAYSDLVALAAHVGDRAGTAMAGPLLLRPNGDVVSAGGVIDRWANVRHLGGPRSNGPYEVDWVDGGVVVVAADVPDLPEDFFLYFEDVAYSHLLRVVGRRLLVDPNVRAVTDPGAGSRRRAFTYFYWRNRLAFCRRYVGVAATAYSVGRLVAGGTRCAALQARQHGGRRARQTLGIYGAALRDGTLLRLGPPSEGVQRLLD